MGETQLGEALSTDSISEQADVPRGSGGRFLPGHAPKSPGRPRKGRSILDATQELAERRWKRVAAAAVSRLEREDAVGARAWSDYRDTYHGVPKQHLVLDAGELPPGMGWLQRLSGEVVEGTSRVIPDTDNESETT